jgi:glycosyltransferase involved in cell wall biosynthesis
LWLVENEKFMKKKILIVQPEVPEYRYPFFSKLNAKFDIVFVHSGKKWDSPKSTKQIIVPLRSFLKFFCYQKFDIFKEVNKSEIVIINGNIRYLSNLLIILTTLILNKKLIWWGHLQSAGGSLFFKMIRLRIAKLANFRLFYTAYEASIYKNKFPRQRLTTSSMSNGLDINKIKNIRSNYDPNNRSIDILFCGRLTTKSNINLLLNATAEIDKFLNVTVIGSGVLLEDIQVDELNNRIGSLNIIPECYNEETISEYFNDSKIFIYPGAAGLSIIHAQSYGVPVLVHDNYSNHMPEISLVRDWGAGATFSYNDVNSLKLEIEKLLSNENKMKDISKKGINATETYFNINCMVENFCSAIRKIS